MKYFVLLFLYYTTCVYGGVHLFKSGLQCIPDTFSCDGVREVECCSGVCEFDYENSDTPKRCKRTDLSVKLSGSDLANVFQKYQKYLTSGVSYYDNFWTPFHPQVNADERFRYYMENHVIVDQMNALQGSSNTGTFSLENNPFADISPEHFREHILMAKRRPHEFPTANSVSNNDDDDVPDEVDWNKKGFVTKVKDQGALGSCWAFSTMGNIESLYAIKSGKLVDLSVEQLVECDSSTEPSTYEADCGMFGGWPHLAFEYLIKAGGVFTWEKMPYCSGADHKGEGKCYPCMSEKYSKKLCGNHDDLYCNSTTTKGQGKQNLCHSKSGFEVEVKQSREISTDENVIKKEVANTGPLSVALNAQALQFFGSGIYDPPDWLCDKKSLDHAVLITGYGYEMVKGFFPWSPKTKKDYWTVKNSWGASWGESGYFRIKRGNGKCGINTMVASAVLA